MHLPILRDYTFYLAASFEQRDASLLEIESRWMVRPSDRLEPFFLRRFDDYLLRDRVVCNNIGLTSKETETSSEE